MLIFIARLLFMTAVWRVAEGKGHPPYRPENANTKCNNTTSEYYLKELKICCSRCKPGTHLSVKCTSDSDTICKTCQDGLYSSNFNHFDNCFKCPTCRDEKGLMNSIKCSADTRSVCVCKPGMYCSNQEFSECKECKKYKSCKAGEGAIKQGSPTSDVKCAPCPPGQFSNRSNTEPCKPHTQCEGSSVLRLGNSTADTVCEMIRTTTTKFHVPISSELPLPQELKKIISQTEQMNTNATSPSSSKSVMSTTTVSQSADPDVMTLFCIVGAAVLVLLMLIVMIIICRLRKRKGLRKVQITDDNKKEQDPAVRCTPDCQQLLAVEGNQKEPSMTSSDSQSQPDSSQSHSSSDWLERSSQEELPEQPSVSSPVVNLSITATFNCQLNPAAASCSIPLNPPARTPHVEAPVQLSQEEVCTSCQQEDGKEALQSVQESGLCVY